MERIGKLLVVQFIAACNFSGIQGIQTEICMHARESSSLEIRCKHIVSPGKAPRDAPGKAKSRRDYEPIKHAVHLADPGLWLLVSNLVDLRRMAVASSQW
jgi:hypothetical protein